MSATDDNRKRNFAAMYCRVLDLEPREWDDCDWDNPGQGSDFVPRFAYLSEERGDEGNYFAEFSDVRGSLVSAIDHDVYGPSGRYPVAMFDLDAGTYEAIQITYNITSARPVPGTNEGGTATA